MNISFTRHLPHILIRLCALALTTVCLGSAAQAQTGHDTTTVRVFDKYLWTYYGTQDRMVQFPAAGKRYEKILMHFRLTCPSGGCGEWDYTNNVSFLRPTGRIDSTKITVNSFTVDGQVKDSVPISYVQTYTYRWNPLSKKIDTMPGTAMILRKYEDPNNPQRLSDSLNVFPAGYYYKRYNPTTGALVDSVYQTPDTILRVSKRDIYQKYEVMDEIEIGRFITPYGKYFAQGREFDWVYDVTEYQYLLHDSAGIRAHYDGYSQGSLFTLDFEFVEGTPVMDVYRVENLWQGYFYYGNASDPIESHVTPKTVTVDPASKTTILKVTTSGHGGGGTDNAAEFSHKTHHINIDGTQRFTQDLWRYDCGQNPVSPQAGTWYFQRGGWCPGDRVYPYFYNLTKLTQAGKPVTIDYAFEPYVNADLSHPAGYGVQAQMLYSGDPNFTNNAELIAIKTPNNAFNFRRMNPICSMSRPLITIRNNGKAPLTSLVISYYINKVGPKTYNWTGNLGMLDTADVALPGISLASGTNTFTAELSNPNGTADEYPRDNAMTVPYTAPKTFSNVIYLTLRTDDLLNDASTTNGISYEVLDNDDNQLYFKSGFADKTTYRDTFSLPDGCYRFVIHDDFYNGNSPWQDGLIPIQGTAGSYLLKDNKNQILINATAAGPDYAAGFGDRATTAFVVSTASGVQDAAEPGTESGGFSLYPNPTSGVFTLDLKSLPRTKPLKVGVYGVDGRLAHTRTIGQGDPATFQLDLSGQPAGTYLIRVDSGHTVWSQKIVLETR